MDLGVFLSSFIALIIFHQRSQSLINHWHPWSLRHWKSVLDALVLGVGMALFQSIALLEGLVSPNAVFESPQNRAHTHINYTNTPFRRRVQIAYGTVSLGLYSIVGLIYADYKGNWFSIPFQLIFSVGYLWVGASVVQNSV